MSFNLEKAPGTLHSVELHGKRAKRSDASTAPTREKRVALSLDLTDPKYSVVLEECWPGSGLLIKGMSGADSPAQDLVSRRKMDDVRVRVYGVDGSEVFSMQVARSLGRPTLRIAKGGSRVCLGIRVVGPLAADLLPKLDAYCEADVLVDIGTVQTTIDDVIDGEYAEAGKALARTTRRGKAKVSVSVGGETISQGEFHA